MSRACGTGDGTSTCEALTKKVNVVLDCLPVPHKWFKIGFYACFGKYNSLRKPTVEVWTVRFESLCIGSDRPLLGTMLHAKSMGPSL